MSNFTVADNTTNSDDLRCPVCSGKMTHSSEMDDPDMGPDNTPFWQCEDCGHLIDDTRK